MKTKFNIVFLSLLAFILSGCIEEHIPSEPEIVKEERIEVKFNLLIPLHDLPSTRAIANDSEIDDYTVWVFDHDTLVEAVRKDEKYQDPNGAEKDKIIYDGTNGGNMYIALDSTLTSVRLMMVANCSVTAPVINKSWTGAEDTLQNQTFNYDENCMYMPMYGTSGAPFAVKQGVEGVIQLRRCMAKIVVDAEGAKDHFILDTISVYNVNGTGTVAPINPIINSGYLINYIEGRVNPAKNSGTVYIPEITNIKDNTKEDGTTNTFVIIKGTYTPIEGGDPRRKYYRFDFIKRTDSDVGISYEAIDSIERNHCYYFKIDYLLEGVGKNSDDGAINSTAANIIQEGISIIDITDDKIMDITTDNYTYLGVTGGEELAKKGLLIPYYYLNIHVVTNNPEGWEMDALPDGVIAWPSEFKPKDGNVTSVQSVWVFFPQSRYHSGDVVTIYIYSGNIRKSIVITMQTENASPPPTP